MIRTYSAYDGRLLTTDDEEIRTGAWFADVFTAQGKAYLKLADGDATEQRLTHRWQSHHIQVE